MWRTRLIDEGNSALTEFVEKYQPDDVQKLRQLIKKAVKEQEMQKNMGAVKALFRFIRSCLE
jgi:ribosome-associated protein